MFGFVQALLHLPYNGYKIPGHNQVTAIHLSIGGGMTPKVRDSLQYKGLCLAGVGNKAGTKIHHNDWNEKLARARVM